MLPIDRLEHLARRFRELDDLMCRQDILSDAKELSKLTRERSDIEPIVLKFAEYRTATQSLSEAKVALGDPDLKALAEEEIGELGPRITELETELQLLLLPSDPNEKRNTVLEIRSGEGGEEAALFAADLFRMYGRYAERAGWTMEVLSLSEAAAGGYKECIALCAGKDVYAKLRFEGGVHRVQRVPATETQGRIHTSTATVAVLPEAEEVDIHIDEKDLDISIAASGGPGGQGVNTTNSAVQIVHRPSGILVKCQDERSQLKNKAKAMKVLRSRLLDAERAKQEAAVSAERKSMVSTGERSQKIRTYNYPQNRVTDHRIKLTISKLDRVVEGELDEIIGALRSHRQAELLESAGMSSGSSSSSRYADDSDDD
jgi:peptide chain release factor 1